MFATCFKCENLQPIPTYKWQKTVLWDIKVTMKEQKQEECIISAELQQNIYNNTTLEYI